MTPVNRSFPVRSAIVLSLLLILLFTAACNRGNPQASPLTMPTPVVTVAQAVTREVPTYLDEIGKNGAYESVMIMPQVGGRIIERHFKDGDNLKKRQLLFVIDPRPYQAQVDSAQAALAQAKAALELATIQFARDKEIIATRAISKQDYDTKQNAVSVGQAQVDAAQAALETAKLNLEYCYIHSPIGGRAGARLVDAGNIVQANASNLLSIQRIDPIYANFTITERDLPLVQKEMSRGTLKALVRLPSDPESAARTGKIEFLDNAVQNGTGTVNMRATIANRDQHFWPGQFVNVRLILATQRGAVLVPNQATQISQQGPFVMVVKPDDTAEVRPVTLGQRQGNEVVVISGVSKDERVIVSGQMLVRPGGKVKIAASAGPASNQPADSEKGGRSDGVSQ